MAATPLTKDSEKDTAPAYDDLLDHADLSEPKWFAHGGTMAGIGFLTVARQLPRLISQAVRMAWQASPRDTVFAVGLSLLGGAFTAFGLLATTGVLEALFAAGPTPDRLRAALPALLLVGAAATIRTLLQAGAGWAQSRLRPQVSRITEERLYGLTSRVDLIRFDDPEFHDSLQRARMRGMSVAGQVVDLAIDTLTGVIGIVAAAGVLGLLHPVLLPLLVLAVVPDAWAAIRAARMSYAASLSLIPARRRKGIILELMADKDTAAEVRSFTMRRFLMRMYDKVARSEQRVMLDVARRQTMARIMGEALGGVGQGAVYVALGVLLAVGAVPLAVAGTAVLAIRAGQQSLANFMYATNRLYEEGLYFTDFLDFANEAERRMTGEAGRGIAGKAERPVTGEQTQQVAERTRHVAERFDRITAEDVTFTYPGGDTPALRGVSIHIDQGEVVALVGENGSGKTTLSKILAGLYDPDLGRIRWDETDLREVDPDQLRSNIAVIAQDHTRWPLTVWHNITMGTIRGEEAVIGAAEVAGADKVIAELPYGYRTLLDRRFKDGHELSGGQWQRIAIARGFYRDAPLLICDEPTAALDARAEHALFERIREHADGRTVLLITHRLASVRYADRIYVLDHGKVIEHGTHHELIALHGVYADLYNLQAQAYQST